MGGGEAEIVKRYGILEDGERGLTAAMVDPPAGALLVARRGDAAGPPVGGVGARALRPGLGEIGRLRVAPEARGPGVARALGGIEDAFLASGLAALRLRTGDRRPEAASLDEFSDRERVHEGRDGRPAPARPICFTKLLTGAT